MCEDGIPAGFYHRSAKRWAIQPQPTGPSSDAVSHTFQPEDPSLPSQQSQHLRALTTPRQHVTSPRLKVSSMRRTKHAIPSHLPSMRPQGRAAALNKPCQNPKGNITNQTVANTTGASCWLTGRRGAMCQARSPSQGTSNQSESECGRLKEC
jgi:hypothetical protein